MQDNEFSTLRSLIWPIHRHEVRKCVPMLIMIVLICFSYEILRNAKDSIVVTASGAETIPFIKVWAILPGSILLTMVLTKLTDRYSQERAFYLMITGFLSFFCLFAFLLYPLRDYLHFHNAADKIEAMLPIGCKGLISVFRNWTFTIFYIMCEMWGSIVFSVLFWGFANEVTHVFEMHRFYSVLAIGSNVAGILAGQFVIWINRSGLNVQFPIGKDPWEQTLMLLILVISVCGIIIMKAFHWMNKNILTDPSFNSLHRNKQETKAKGKITLRDSFAVLASSKYLRCIGVVVVSYSLAINMVEVVWKDQLSQLYPSPRDYNAFMSNMSTTTGIVSTIMAIFMTKIIYYGGWTKTALITPIIMLITSIGFFYFYFFQNYMDSRLLGITPLAISVFFGAAHNCLSKSAKYSFFDATKEMAFIPLSHEHKLKGKAAIDGVGSRLGKSGGSFIHSTLLVICGTLTNSSPYVAVILTGMTIFWISATKTLGREVEKVAEQNAI